MTLNPLIAPPANTISDTTKRNRYCCKIHILFYTLLAIFILAVHVDRSDVFPAPILIRIDSFSVSSLNLNISYSPDYPSSVSAKWNVTFSARNQNWKLTDSVQNVKATILYRGASLSTGDAAAAPFRVLAKQRASSRVESTTTQHVVKNWVVKNIAADQIRDDAVTLDISVKMVWSAKKQYSAAYICTDLKVVFNPRFGYEHGVVTDVPWDCFPDSILFYDGR